MPKGEWAFIHEWTIYEYMMVKFSQDSLRVRWVVKQGNINLKDEYVKVTHLCNIVNTTFPDIDEIQFQNSKEIRVAEVKFLTSKFGYHRYNGTKNGELNYKRFIEKRGCIVVLSHDEMPKRLTDKIDVYELDEKDFQSFIRENLTRLLNRQIHKRTYHKIWVMYQAPNFNKGNTVVSKAREVGRWCPTDNLNGFDLVVGDTVIFIKTRGSRKQDLDKNSDRWKLDEIYVSKVTSGIMSRQHYCQNRSIDYQSPLWYDETPEGKRDRKLTKRVTNSEWRWKRVFEFQCEEVYDNLDMRISDMSSKLTRIREICKNTFKYNTSCLLEIDDYIELLQCIARKHS